MVRWASNKSCSIPIATNSGSISTNSFLLSLFFVKLCWAIFGSYVSWNSNYLVQFDNMIPMDLATEGLVLLSSIFAKLCSCSMSSVYMLQGCTYTLQKELYGESWQLILFVEALVASMQLVYWRLIYWQSSVLFSADMSLLKIFNLKNANTSTFSTQPGTPFGLIGINNSLEVLHYHALHEAESLLIATLRHVIWRL